MVLIEVRNISVRFSYFICTLALIACDGTSVDEPGAPSDTPSTPSLTFTVQDSNVSEGDSTQLQWNATEVLRCRSESNPAHPDWVNDQLQGLSSDGFDITNLQADTRFTLTCRGIDNSLLSKTLDITVTPAPVVDGGDTDGDGVVNSIDFCISTPMGETPDANGCANSELITLQTIGTNVGGREYVAADGTYFQADAFVSDRSKSPSRDIRTNRNEDFGDATEDDELLRSIRFGSNTFNIPVSNGLYNIEMLTSETHFTAANGRVFHIDIEGQRVLSDYDVFAVTGDRFIADSLKFNFVSVDDGELTIDLISLRNFPLIASIKATKVANPGLDDDGDGIANNRDQCFSTPAGASINTDGCLDRPLGAGRFVLIDTDNNRQVGELVENQVLDIASLPTNLTVEFIADPLAQHTGFSLGGGTLKVRTDSRRPFSFAGEEHLANGSISYRPWSLGVPLPLESGSVEITAESTLFPGGRSNPANDASTSHLQSVKFTITDSRPRVALDAVVHGVKDFRTFSNGVVPSYAYTLDDIVFYAPEEVPREDATRWLNWYNDCNDIYKLTLDREPFLVTDPNFGPSKPLGFVNDLLCGNSRSAGCGDKRLASGDRPSFVQAQAMPGSVLPHWVLMYEMGRGGFRERFNHAGIWPKNSWGTALPHAMAMLCFHTAQGDRALEDPGATPGRLIARLDDWERENLEFAVHFNAGSVAPYIPHDLIAAMVGRIFQATGLITIRGIFRELATRSEHDNAVDSLCEFVDSVNVVTNNLFNDRMRGPWGLPDQCNNLSK